MSFRLRNLGEILLRVPPLFVIDEILKIGIGIHELTEHDLSNLEEKHEGIGQNIQNVTTSVGYNPVVYKIILFGFLRLLLSALALCLFILNSRHLSKVYLYLMSVGVVFISYWSNVTMVKVIIDAWENKNHEWVMPLKLIFNFNDFLEELYNDNLYLHLIKNCWQQGILALIFVNTHLGPRYATLQKILPLTFFTPAILTLTPIPPSWLMHAPVICALLPLALVIFVLWFSIVLIIEIGLRSHVYARHVITNMGMAPLLEAEWIRLNVPEVLRTFWMLRVMEQTRVFFVSGYWNEDDGDSPYYRLLKYLMVTGCDTVTAVLGITSIVSFICNYIGKIFQWFLLTEENNDKNIGTVSAIVFYILALQTGLTGLEPEVRFIRLCRNFCLLFTAILHFIHNVVNPLLMTLSASPHPSLRRHVHALVVCFILVILPVALMVYLWSTQEMSTWLLAVTAFSIEVIVKVFVSLAVYSLFLLDARRDIFWEKLDDYIYYIRAFGNTVEFCFGIFLFFNGAWILLFESGSAIRAIMMCIHAYFNIWLDALAGWSVFMKRRTAVNKIESLPEAEEEQLRNLDDVCAICYQEMRSAKITRCKHFFHGVCLRKWLYVQDRCPLCHEILHALDQDDKKEQQTAIIPAPPPPEVENVER